MPRGDANCVGNWLGNRLVKRSRSNGERASFCPISRRDVADADKWIMSRFVPGWSWEHELTRARRRPRRVEAAIYAEVQDGSPVLCALTSGSHQQWACCCLHSPAQPSARTQPFEGAGCKSGDSASQILRRRVWLHCGFTAASYPGTGFLLEGTWPSSRS